MLRIEVLNGIFTDDNGNPHIFGISKNYMMNEELSHIVSV